MDAIAYATIKGSTVTWHYDGGATRTSEYPTREDAIEAILAWEDEVEADTPVDLGAYA